MIQFPAITAASSALTSSLPSLGGVVSGLGSLASGLGMGGKKTSLKDINSQHEMQWLWDVRRAEDYPYYAVQGAKKAGLHPLVAMGQSPSAGSSGGAIQAGGFDPAEMGQGVARALNAGRSKLQQELDNLAVEKAKLSNDYLKTQIAASQQQIAKNTGSAPLATNTRIPNTRFNNGGNRNPTLADKLGVTPEILNSSTLYRNYDGSVSIYPSEALSEALESYGIAGQVHYMSRNAIPYEAKKGDTGKPVRWSVENIPKKYFAPFGKLVPRSHKKAYQQAYKKKYR